MGREDSNENDDDGKKKPGEEHDVQGHHELGAAARAPTSAMEDFASCELAAIEEALSKGAKRRLVPLDIHKGISLSNTTMPTEVVRAEATLHRKPCLHRLVGGSAELEQPPLERMVARVPPGSPGAIAMRGPAYTGTENSNLDFNDETAATDESDGDIAALETAPELRRAPQHPPINDEIISAHLVPDDMEQVAGLDHDKIPPIEVARPTIEALEARKLETPRRRERAVRIGFLTGIILVLVAVGVCIGVVVTSQQTDTDRDADNSEHAADSMSNEESSGPIPYPPFRDDMHSSSIRSMKDPQSPASKANTWMWQDPYLDQYAKERQFQRFALAILYYSTNGDGWTRNDNWLSHTVEECSWWWHVEEGRISACNDEGFIQGLLLRRNNLTGSMPVGLHYFEQLSIVDVSDNDLDGNAPHMMLSTNVREVNISHNRFQGIITGVAGYTSENLNILDVSYNQLHGDNTNQALTSFPNLTHFDISHNKFAGQLPTPLEQSQLRTLVLAHNDFSGTISSEYGTLTTLEELDIASNSVSGSIPEELSLMSQLTFLDVSGNPELSGTIPEELCLRQQMGHLVIRTDVDIIESCP